MVLDKGDTIHLLIQCLCIGDLREQLKSCNVDCNVNGYFNHIMYADDLILISPSSAGLCQLLYECKQFGKSNDVKYNTTESGFMVFRSNILKGCTILSAQLSGIILNVVVTYTYLGHYITYDPSGDAEINRKRRTLSVQGNITLRTFYMCSIYLKLTLFRILLFTNVFCTVMVELQNVYYK